MLYTIADKRVPSTVPRLEGTVVSSNSYQALAPFQYIALIATERKNGATAAITGGSSSPEAERGRQEGAGRPGRAAAGAAEERRPLGRRGRGAEGAAERRGGGPLHPTPTTRRPEDAASLFLPPGGAWRPLPRRLLAVAGGGSLSGRCPLDEVRFAHPLSPSRPGVRTAWVRCASRFQRTGRDRPRRAECVWP